MKPTKLFFFFTALSCGAFVSAAETPSKAQQLNDSYVEGLRLLSGIRVGLGQARSVSGIVEQGVETQAVSIQSMDARLTEVRGVSESLGQDAARELEEGRRLLDGRSTVERHFSALEQALADSDRLLSGATNTVRELGLAADKSGSRFDRELALTSLEQLKGLSQQLHIVEESLSQQRLRVRMEATLLEGLFPKAEASAKEIGLVSEEAKHLTADLLVQQENLKSLRMVLAASRARTTKEDQDLAKQLEAFRLVQVQVLRRWLLDGPPAGQVPELSLTDIVEASLNENRMAPSETSVMGPGAGVVDDAKGKMTSFGRIGAAGKGSLASTSRPEGTDYSPQVLELSKRAEWYVAMLGRLVNFGEQSRVLAQDWTQASEQWRNQLSSVGSRLAEQKGTLASLEMEQDITTRSLALLSKQAGIAQAEVERLCVDMDAKSARLAQVTQSLDKLSSDTK